LIHYDSEASNVIDHILQESQMERFLLELFKTELNVGAIMINRKQFDLASAYCQRCLAYSRRWPVESELKITFMFKALHLNRDLRKKQGDESGAPVFAEECYNFLAEAYDPGRKQVQEAAMGY
jgi:hypothetical protein